MEDLIIFIINNPQTPKTQNFQPSSNLDFIHLRADAYIRIILSRHEQLLLSSL